jgi:methionine-rich copper-binding protein CopC
MQQETALQYPPEGREKEMSQPDSRQPANARGPFPYGPPGNHFGTADIGAIQDEEWHHDDTSLPGHHQWGSLEESGQAADWPDRGVFMPADDDGQPAWDGPPSSTQPFGTPANRVVRHLPARLIATAAALIACVAAITFVAYPRNHTIRISPADNPAAAASPRTPSMRSGGPSPSPQPQPAALTKAAAERILASYWQVNNTANQSRSGTLLKTVEAGSSYSMDAGTYQMDRVTDPANRQYTPFTAENATYYIPRQPAGVYPRWFAVRVTYANLAAPQHATGAGYVLFTQAAENAPWKNVLEPYMLTGTGPGPFIETDADGYAIAASASDESGLSVTSAQIQEATAESLDSRSATVKNPGNLADLRDEAYFGGKLPAGSTDTDKHSTWGRVFALKTVGGGVLAFYALTAQLTLAPPSGQTFEVGIPGFYSSSQSLTSATIGYAEQFATYIPPDQASPQILADASGITGRG